MASLGGKIASAALEVAGPVTSLAGITHAQSHPGNQPGSDFVHVSLSPSYGSLNKDSVRKLDENTKVMISTAMRTILFMRENERTFGNVVKRLKTNPLLETVDGPGTHRSDQLTKSGSHNFKFDGSPDPNLVREIETWFRKLIADDDILKTMHVNIEQLAKITAQTGATVTGVGSFFGKTQDESKTVLDIGALRYPDIDNPYFKVYRIKVTAWSHSHRILFHSDDSNGVLGDFDCCRFRPQPAAIAALKAEARASAIEEADSMFDPITPEKKAQIIKEANDMLHG